MTFEEFFIKKRIDLAQLQRARPDLYEEFRGHYILMGEKSFDHTKKYWFNRLRKEYLLQEEEVAKATIANAPAAETSGATVGGSPKPTGFKPRFKAGSTQPAKAAIAENKTAEEQVEPPKNTADESDNKAHHSEKVPEVVKEEPISKPSGFKPRFKPGVTGKKKDAPEG